jgi:plasmid stabilization system protein ParE
MRTDFTQLPVRFHLLLPYRTYWIVYDPSTKPVEIIRILHTSIDVSNALS